MICSSKTMLKKNKILIISNGHGEDVVGSLLIKNLKLINPQINIEVLPLVGDGKYYDQYNVIAKAPPEAIPIYKDCVANARNDTYSIKILGPRKLLPSGGFSLRHLRHLFKDIQSGYLNHLIQTVQTLRKNKKQYDLVIAIGDIISVLAGILVQCPIIYLGINKSAYYKSWGFNYLWLEKIILKYCVKKTFSRDQLTSNQLSAFGINSVYVGNPMMDAVIMPNASRGAGSRNNICNNIEAGKCQMSNEGKIIIGFLPGTRHDDAKLNIEDFEKIAKEITLIPRYLDPLIPYFLIATQEEVSTIFKKVSFDELLSQSNIIIGLSGTGNEQAAGCGIPIVSFFGRGSQYNAKFAQAQKELLGEALKIVKNDPKEVILTINNILTQKETYDKMSRAGKERMGKPGAIKEFCEEIIK